MSRLRLKSCSNFPALDWDILRRTEKTGDSTGSPLARLSATAACAAHCDAANGCQVVVTC